METAFIQCIAGIGQPKSIKQQTPGWKYHPPRGQNVSLEGGKEESVVTTTNNENNFYDTTYKKAKIISQLKENVCVYVYACGANIHT